MVTMKETAARPTSTDRASDRDIIRTFREIIRRAVLTIRAIPDIEARFLHTGRVWGDIVHDVNEAYGYGNAIVRSFQPTPYEIDQAFEVWRWLVWLGEIEGQIAVKRITAWATGISTWMLAEREGCSERSIMNRIDRGVAHIVEHVTGDTFELAVVDEPYKETPFAMVLKKAEAATPAGGWAKASPGYLGREVVVGKVYVYGLGLMRNGKSWSAGRR